ncbi:MAG: S9 family peptidase [Xanthomonadaceae bacterium]|nr:S9 family peptidase [Xanthomonadaceae bacterium]
MSRIACSVAGFALAFAGVAMAQAPVAGMLGYPPAERAATVDTYGTVKVPAPYQWMETLDSPGVARWVAAENALTARYLAAIPLRAWIKQRLTTLWNYPKVGVPTLKGGKLFFGKNSGLQNQSVLYVQDGLHGKPRELLDPNTLSRDGSIALLDDQPSPDGRYLAYGLSQGGSDWETLHVRDVASGRDLTDEVHWVKFSGIAWTRDDKGFFYSRYPAPPKGQAISDRVRDQALYYHVLGTPQSADRRIYARPDLPEWIIGGSVSHDGRYLFVYLVNGTSTHNELYVADLGDPAHPDVGAPLKPLFTGNDAGYTPVGNLGDTVYLLTTRDAPRGRIVAFRLDQPAPAYWRSVVPQGRDVIQGALLAGGDVVVERLVDVKSEVSLYSPDGKLKGTLPLPGIGSVGGLSGQADSPQLFYAFTSFLYPTSVYRYDVATAGNHVFFKPPLSFDPSRFETRQVFYRSKDGTRIPMFITARKGLKLDGRNPTLLYAYGGFDISVTPGYSPLVPVWLEMGGVYAVANLRGGGEYGEAWHHAGMLGNKQNVFDDFAWAAKYLIREKITATPHLGIEGYSNGGLLVGASITEHPHLFGAAYAGAGVLDMLRYEKFSGGALWEPEYGDPNNPQAFQWLIKYSPLQNVRAGTCYPPTIISTADHDDRVVPSHSYKFTAAMQHAQACAHPILIRVETQTSHGYMPTDKRIQQSADIAAFMAWNLGIKKAPAAAASGH